MMKLRYTYDYPRPILAADSVIFTLKDGRLQVLLVKRGHEPYEGHWAIPGGFVNENEPLDAAGARELREETGLQGIPLRQMHSFGDPGRDPRGWTVSVVYLALIDSGRHDIRAGDDAREAAWFPLSALPPLAFDHGQIVDYALKRLAEAVRREKGDAGLVPATLQRRDLESLMTELNRVAQGD